jgi:hypothetical protein
MLIFFCVVFNFTLTKEKYQSYTPKLNVSRGRFPFNRELRIPEQIVLQYLGYCKDVGFTPVSRSTLCKVLSVCSASTTKSLQGLDYVSAAGAKAFDELEKVVDKLGDDYGKGFTWAKVQKKKLQLAKRYLKGDYKVKIFGECSNFILTKEKYQSHTPELNVARGRFPFNRELRDFRNGGKWYGNFLGKCPEI